MSRRILTCAALVSATALAAVPSAARAQPAGERVGLYPIALPWADRAQGLRLAAWIQEGAATLPGVRSLEVISEGACLPDEGRCLGLAAKTAKLDAILSARVDATERGYKWRLRRFLSNGEPRGEEQGEVIGGPLDLAGSIEGGVCRVLGAAPCAGELQIAAEPALTGQHLFVDGRDAGALPLARPLSLPIGRHAVRVAASERRVRVSQGKVARVFAGQGASGPSLSEEPVAAAAPNATSEAPPLLAAAAGPTRLYSAAYVPHPIALRTPTADGRTIAVRALVASGLGLIAAGAGVGLFAQIEGHRLDQRYRSGALSDADKPGYGQVHTAGLAASALVATGVGALAAGGLVFALTPSGPSLSGKF